MKQMYLLLATFLCCSMSLLAQRPENVYAIQALQGNKNAVPTANEKTVPAVSRSSSQLASRSCADCYTVSFEISNDSLIEIYDEGEIWNHTYEFTVPINNYKGYWDYEEACMTFMHYADTTWSSMAYWDGFTISNTKDFDCDTACNSSCTDFHNQFAAMPKDGKGRGSDKYAVAYDGYNEFFFQERHCNITLSQDDPICGLFLTLNAYTYKSIKCGDDFAGAFEYGDYYYVTIKGYLNGTLTDTVVYYLADYRDSTAYVVDDWKWVNLQGLGTVDSLAFELTTSDSGQYGPNTPMYFCLDEIKVGTCQSCAATDNTHDTFPTPGYSASKADVLDLKIEVSPNPVNSVLTVQTESGSNISILSKEGSIAKKLKATASLVDVPVSDLYPGMYIIHCENGGRTASTTFIKN
jgi:hypothetical protein